MDPMTRPVWEESIEKGHLANLNGFSIKGDYFYLIESERIGRGIVTPLALILSKSMSQASFWKTEKFRQASVKINISAIFMGTKIH